MSRASLVCNSVESYHAYLSSLKGLKYGPKPKKYLVSAIYLFGSRSANTHRTPTEISDWDIMIVSEMPNLRLPSPRINTKVLHADVTVKTKAQMIELFESGSCFSKDLELVWKR